MFFSGNNKTGQYDEIEKTKGSKYRLSRELRIARTAAPWFMGGLVAAGFYGELTFFKPIWEANLAYIYIAGVFTLAVAILTFKWLYYKKISFPKMLGGTVINSIIKKILNFINPAIKFIDSLVDFPVDLRKKLGFELGWIEKLDKKFFNQVVEFDDTYKRSDKLLFMSDLKYIFGETEYKNIKALFVSEEEFNDLWKIAAGYLNSGLYDIYIDDNELDVFPHHFVEEYNRQYFLNNPHVDVSTDKYEIISEKMLEKVKAEDQLKLAKMPDASDEMKKTIVPLQAKIASCINEINTLKVAQSGLTCERDYKYFQSYKLRKNENGVPADCVVLSRNAIKIFIQQHKYFFYTFMETVLFSHNHSSEAHIKAQNYFNLLIKDISFAKKIEKKCGVAKAKDLSILLREEKALSNDEFRFVLFEMLMADFTLVIFREVLKRYVLLPAGTMVVKIDSYDTRMILDSYSRKSYVDISPAKNDGSTALFDSDNYVNLFLHCYYSYLDEPKFAFLEELKWRFNTDLKTKPFEAIIGYNCKNREYEELCSRFDNMEG